MNEKAPSSRLDLEITRSRKADGVSLLALLFLTACGVGT